VDELRREDLLRDGPLLERHPRFPGRTNVQLARVASRKEIELLIWERGAGETSASGTSSSAVAAAAYRRGLIDRAVRMLMPGGGLDILVRNDMSISMNGPVSPVMRGRFLF
jgi:diaminopimelate epimerase